MSGMPIQYFRSHLDFLVEEGLEREVEPPEHFCQEQRQRLQGVCLSVLAPFFSYQSCERCCPAAAPLA